MISEPTLQGSCLRCLQKPNAGHSKLELLELFPRTANQLNSQLLRAVRVVTMFELESNISSSSSVLFFGMLQS